MNLKLISLLFFILLSLPRIGIAAEKVEQTKDQKSPTETLDSNKEEAKWTPSATEFDWVQLTSGEWLKGEIKSMYSEELEFDSDKLGLLSIDMDDVRYLQSFQSLLVNIENTGEVQGVLKIAESNVTLSHESQNRKFDTIEIISFAPGGETEADLWWIKFTLGFDIKEGNTSQIDFSSKLSAKRRTGKSRFVIDYIGNISKTDAVSGSLVETINNHRANFNLDKYATRYFFYTPLFGEYFTDTFQNIDKRLTLGVGLGYTLINSDKTDWNISGGPSILSTKYTSVQSGDDQTINSASLSLSTDYESELSSKIDFIFKYKVQLSKKESGGYSHHLIATLENELINDFDFDISIVWDRINDPTVDENQITPEKDDLRFILGISYTY